jgi:hypothetical protein
MPLPTVERGMLELPTHRDVPARAAAPDTPLRDLAQPPPPERILTQVREEMPNEVQLLRQIIEPLQPTFQGPASTERKLPETAAPPPPIRPAVERLIMPAPPSVQVAPHEPPPAVDTEPVIRVVINRVEVRAVQSSAPPPQQRPAPTPPRLTLDDYLRARR